MQVENEDLWCWLNGWTGALVAIFCVCVLHANISIAGLQSTRTPCCVSGLMNEWYYCCDQWTRSSLALRRIFSTYNGNNIQCMNNEVQLSEFGTAQHPTMSLQKAYATDQLPYLPEVSLSLWERTKSGLFPSPLVAKLKILPSSPGVVPRPQHFSRIARNHRNPVSDVIVSIKLQQHKLHLRH